MQVLVHGFSPNSLQKYLCIAVTNFVSCNQNMQLAFCICITIFFTVTAANPVALHASNDEHEFLDFKLCPTHVITVHSLPFTEYIFKIIKIIYSHSLQHTLKKSTINKLSHLYVCRLPSHVSWAHKFSTFSFHYKNPPDFLLH